MTAGPRRNELIDLAFAVCDGTATDDQIRSIEEIVSADPAARLLYLQCLEMHFEMDRRAAARETSEFGDLEIWRFGDFGIGDSGLGAEDSGFGIRDFQVPNLQINKSPTQQILSPLHPSLSTTHYPLPTPFVGGPVFSYIAATLILGVMLLSAWAYTITRDYGAPFVQNSTYVTNSRGSTPPGLSTPQRPELLFVGRVTGMKDCRWSDPTTAAFVGSYVPLNRKYALSSGLMEIAYDSGAKVILEGPCFYEVDSSAGGFLALGKLTAKVESGERKVESAKSLAAASTRRKQRSEVGGQRSENSNPKSQIPNHKSKISKSPNLQIPKSLFTVRTPTAVVTDLGTEFGVEVAANGETASHVFQGRVVMWTEGSGIRGQGSGNEISKSPNLHISKSVVLSAGQSARVEKDTKSGELRLTSGEQTLSAQEKFVRRLREPPKLLDLLDIVCGGDGTGNRREHGLDPCTGMQDPTYVPGFRFGYSQYHPITWHRLIDGVFVPDGSSGAVQVDSSKHAFDGFPPTNKKTYGSIWSRATKVMRSDLERDLEYWIYAIGNAEQFVPEKRGLLALCPNAGITFSLEAMRKQWHGVEPVRFRATAGMADARHLYPAADGIADIWILIDGRLKFHREKIRLTDAPISVNVPLASVDRYLTIVATDGGNGCDCDWIVFGDPVLEMGSNDRDDKKSFLRKKQQGGPVMHYP